MTGEKRTETRMRCYNTVHSLYIYHSTTLPACIVYDCREGRGVIYREFIHSEDGSDLPVLVMECLH